MKKPSILKVRKILYVIDATKLLRISEMTR